MGFCGTTPQDWGKEANVHLYRRNGDHIGEGESLVELCQKFRANLRGADLRDANLYCADLRGAISLHYSVVPSGGSFHA